MNQFDKKKRIAIIIAAAVLIAAIIVAVIFATKSNNNAQKIADETEYVTIIDENGNAVTLLDDSKNPVTKNPDTQSENTTSKKNNDKNSGNSNSAVTTEKVTETTTQFTTNSPDTAIVTPDVPLDEYTLTNSLALYRLQEYYGEKYIVNYDEPNNKDTDNIAFAVFANDDEKTNIEYRVIVNLYSGKAIQTDKKGKSTEITKEINK